MNMQTSTLKFDESGEPLHLQQRKQIEVYREAWKEAGHTREPRVSVSRSIFALVDDRDRAYFGVGRQESDQIGYIDENTRAIFGRSYAAEPDVLIEQLAEDEAIAAADTPAHRAQSAWRRIQRSRLGEHREARRTRTGLALTWGTPRSRLSLIKEADCRHFLVRVGLGHRELRRGGFAEGHLRR
jgi:hypothetical protein